MSLFLYEFQYFVIMNFLKNNELKKMIWFNFCGWMKVYEYNDDIFQIKNFDLIRARHMKTSELAIYSNEYMKMKVLKNRRLIVDLDKNLFLHKKLPPQLKCRRHTHKYSVVVVNK